MYAELQQSLRGDEIFVQRMRTQHVKTDRLFGLLFVLQWIGAVLAACLISPRTWEGSASATHLHVWSAVILGGVITSLPLALVIMRPGQFSTRIIVSIAQALFSSLLIHLSGGRIETHFHIFGSLAFLAFYKDWRVLVPATIVVAIDHAARGYFWPESVFGVITASPWRAVEHAAWVLFEDAFLAWSCVQSVRELRASARAHSQLEMVNLAVENLVAERTAELENRTIELETALEHEKEMESQLARSQKLEAIGQLSAGVAHEINTPMQFVNDNIHFLKDCTDGLFQVLSSCRENLIDDRSKKTWQERKDEFLQIESDLRFERMKQQIPLAIEESLEGVQRVVGIVRAMKQFSHPGSAEKVSTNVNEAIRSTVTISKNRWKYAADIHLDLTDNLPDVKTLPAELNQVLLNLVVNAGDAIMEKVGENTGEKGQITIRTYASYTHFVIEVADTGAGIPEEMRAKIFDPFFTTKDVGKGTGQGLSISYDVIVNRHEGMLEVDSEVGVGTTFTIRLPLTYPNMEALETEAYRDEAAGESNDSQVELVL